MSLESYYSPREPQMGYVYPGPWSIGKCQQNTHTPTPARKNVKYTHTHTYAWSAGEMSTHYRNAYLLCIY